MCTGTCQPKKLLIPLVVTKTGDQWGFDYFYVYPFCTCINYTKLPSQDHVQ